MNKARETIIALSIVHNGDWNKIFECIKNKTLLEDRVVDNAMSIGYDCLTLIDAEYPEKVKQKSKPPFVIYCDGNRDLLISNETKHFGVLNDTLASNYAIESTFKIVKDLIDERVIVIPYSSKKSGEFIQKVIKNGGKVIAILDKGIGELNCDNLELYRELKKNHLIISTYPQNVAKKTLNTEITAIQLFSSICDEILIGGVCDRTPQSSSIGFGLANGSTIYCIPFPMGSNFVNNRLIREGAVLVETANDILEESWRR